MRPALLIERFVILGRPCCRCLWRVKHVVRALCRRCGQWLEREALEQCRAHCGHHVLGHIVCDGALGPVSGGARLC